MAFVTSLGSLKLNWDVTYDRYDPIRGEKSQDGNRLPVLSLTEVENFDFQPNGEAYREQIWRGQPNPVGMHWNDTPVFRILTNRFKSGYDWIEDAAERYKTDWGRFMRDYEHQTDGRGTQLMFYEPHIDDIRVDEDSNNHFPLWVIDKLIEWKEFDRALVLNKVNLPGVPRLTKQEYDRIMKEIETRKSGNISRPTKSSASKTS